MVSISLVSIIITNKIINALLYIQEQDFKRGEINLTKQDMSNYMYQANYIVSSVIDKIKEERINLLLPKCNELFSYIQEQYDKCLVKSSIGSSLSYTLNWKEGFMNIFKDGML